VGVRGADGDRGGVVAMIFYFRIPDAEVLGYDRTKALYRLLEAACADVAREQGVGRGLLAAWEVERSSSPRSDEGSFKAPTLRLVDGS
jgi:hypothetical protein